MKKLKQKLKHLRPKKGSKTKAIAKAKEYIKGEDVGASDQAPARVTNDTVAQYREEILSGARRFIYPLKHSKHRIAIISSIIIGVTLIGLVFFSWWLLYRQQSVGDFAYRISQIIPFPVAKVNGDYVRYEEYLFELRHNMHYLINQENVDFTTPEGASQLNGLKDQAMDKAIDQAVVEQMAKELNINVTDQEVTEQIDLIRSQGGLGQDAQTLEDTLDDFYGWSLGDLRRVIKDQILRQKLIPLLDVEAKPKAEQILADILAGEDFAKQAKAHSDDPFTKNNGGSFGFIFRSNTEIPPQIVERAFTLAAGEVSEELVETLFGYHVVKTIEYRGNDEANVAHILTRFNEINEYVDARKQNLEINKYIELPDPSQAVQSQQIEALPVN